MADTKISALTALTGANVALADDVLPIVDTSTTTTKKITMQEAFNSAGSLATLAGASVDISADLIPIYDASAGITKVVLAGGIGGATAATQAEQETGTSTTAYVSPGRQQYHPSAAKVWCVADAAGAITTSYNMTSVTDTGTGDITFTIGTDFSSGNYAAFVAANSTSDTLNRLTYLTNPAAGSIRGFRCNTEGTAVDPTAWYFVAYGDQA